MCTGVCISNYVHVRTHTHPHTHTDSKLICMYIYENINRDSRSSLTVNSGKTFTVKNTGIKMDQIPIKTLLPVKVALQKPEEGVKSETRVRHRYVKC